MFFWILTSMTKISWTEGEGWLDDLIECRTELIQGDFIILYLAWLKAAERALQIEEIDEETLEPPVPAGLGQLSPALKTFVKFLEIDPAMIAVAAQKSGKAQQQKLQLEAWIKKLPATEQHDFLARQGEKNLILNKRLQKLANEAKPQQKSLKTERRTILALIETSEDWSHKQKAAAERKAAQKRQRELEALATRTSEIWQEVEILIEEKKAKSYQSAVGLLQDLHDLAEYQGELDKFRQRLVEIKQTYSTRTALLRRLREAKLIA